MLPLRASVLPRESASLIKLVMPMKRRAGMSIAEFRDYYESKHRLIGEKYLRGYATKYIRRFIDPLPDRNGVLSDPEFDVLLEIWYPDRDAFEQCGQRLRAPDVAAEIREDEAQLFDLEHMRSYLVEEHESAM